MLTRILTRCQLTALAVASVLITGCSDSSATVSGDVTYEGQPVKSGYVTFTPADGKGPAVGAQINDAKYTAKNLMPGSKVVKVEASSGAGPSVQSSAEMEKLSKEWRSKVGRDGIIHTETVPANSVGNNRTVELKAGVQTLDIHLTKPVADK